MSNESWMNEVIKTLLTYMMAPGILFKWRVALDNRKLSSWRFCADDWERLTITTTRHTKILRQRMRSCKVVWRRWCLSSSCSSSALNCMRAPQLVDGLTSKWPPATQTSSLNGQSKLEINNLRSVIGVIISINVVISRDAWLFYLQLEEDIL